MNRRELEIKDKGEIKGIIEKAKILHLGLIDEGLPYIVPMNYGFEMENGKLTLYLHSAVKGYKIDVMKKSPVCCFELECDVAPFEGEKPCQNGMVYSSVIGRGKVSFITDGDDKIHAMKVLMKTQTGRDFDFTERELSAVAMIRIDVSEYTAKRRPHPLERRGK
ncbi:MAG: pyridoxamine 5'-phosphate oxidase family protein [Firmicutes bacterium]|nr:pyridoxamine 5'-phosphate oxidase family protein [Bacillota bacterium]